MIFWIKATWKYLLSLAKKEWSIQDYPLRYIHQEVSGCQENGFLRTIPWTVQIVNWWQMAGHGDTKEAAYAELAKRIEDYKSSGEILPRPGTGRPLEFFSCEGIIKYESMTEDFFQRILNMKLEDVLFLSDKSSLFDFHFDDSNNSCYEKIKSIYGVDVSDIKSGNLLEIFQRIDQKD
jgi:hypothetical protein